MLIIFNNRDNQNEISRKNIDMENYLVKQVEESQFQFFDKSYHIIRIIIDSLYTVNFVSIDGLVLKFWVFIQKKGYSCTDPCVWRFSYVYDSATWF